MKKLLLTTLFFLVTYVFADNETPKAFFYDSVKINYDKISEACKSVEAFQIKSFLDYGCGENSILYASPLDTTVSFGVIFEEGFFIVERISQYCEGSLGTGFTTVGEPGKLQFSEVLQAEFLRLQELGVLNLPKDSAYLFITQKIAAMKEEDTCNDIDLSMGKPGVGLYGCCSLVEPSTAIRSLQLQKNSKLFAYKLTENFFLIEGVPEHATYRLFDLNGKLLHTGKLSGMHLKIPTLPAILEIGGRSILVKH